MNKNTEILSMLIDEDYGLETKENSRWGKSSEHDSLVLDKDRGVFYWNSQGIVGDALTYLIEVRRLPIDVAKEYLHRFDYSETFTYTINSPLKGKADVVVFPKLVDVFFEDGQDKKRRDYFYRRGLTDSTIDRFRLGWFNNYNMVPFFEDNSFRNFQMRRDIPTKRIHGYYENVGPLLFNSDILKLVDTIYYVEGPVDAMMLIQNGIPAVCSNIGGGYLPEWYSRFLRIKDIFIVFDNDKGGREEAKRLAKFLGIGRCKIYNFQDFNEKTYDPVDYFMDGHTREEFKELIDEKSRYIFEI